MSLSSNSLELISPGNKTNFQSSTLVPMKSSPQLKEGFLCTRLEFPQFRTTSPKATSHQALEPLDTSSKRHQFLINLQEIAIPSFSNLSHTNEEILQPKENDKLTIREKIEIGKLQDSNDLFPVQILVNLESLANLTKILRKQISWQKEIRVDRRRIDSFQVTSEQTKSRFFSQRTNLILGNTKSNFGSTQLRLFQIQQATTKNIQKARKRYLK